MSGKISQYTEALSVANDDFFDVSIDTGGGVYATRKVRKSNLGIGGNFADSDLTFTGNRLHDLNGNSLTIEGNSGNDIFQIDSTGKFFLGALATTTNNTNVAVGTRADGTGTNSVAVGYYAQATFNESIMLNANGVARNTTSANSFSVHVGGGTANVLHLSKTSDSYITGTNLGLGLLTPTARFNVQGVGSTSATKTALFQNALGNDSLRVGDDGSVWNARASFSTSFGFEALLNETGGQNTSFGHQALRSATNGIRNVAVGYKALNVSTFAGSNTALGHEAGLIATGSNNVFVGRSAGSVVTSKDQVTCVGAVSGTGGVGDYSTTLGWNSAGAGVGSTAIGSEARTSVSYASIINCARGIRTNSTSNSLEVYVDNVGTDPVFKVAQSSDSFYAGSGSFGFGTLTPDASSVADMVSTTKGFLPPRMTTTQKNAISTPATGLVVYDSTLNKLCVYTGASWETVTSA